MKKTSDTELNAWRLQYPSTTVSWNLTGDPDYCQKFVGEAKIMLYQLKNRMNIAVPKLKSFQDIHRSEDGTIIIVRSIFGQDFIDIDVSRALGAAISKCTITFISFPLSVPPMKNPGVIKPTDVQGVDYFKTYYSVNIRNCPTCQDIAWDFTFNYAVPLEPRHFHNDGKIPQMGVDPGKDDPNNHTIYSLYPPCQAEIISHGQDGGGTYIVWKAYTEAGSALTFSRTGLGIMLLTAAISNNKGILCSQEKKIDVDCCKKKSDLRNVEIWWEGVGACEPFIIYNGKHICLMPDSLSMLQLITYSTPFYAAQPLYAIPEIKGSCIPLEWTVTGPIKLVNPGPYGTATYFQITSEPGDCFAQVGITLTDRCGGSYRVTGRPCCDDAGPMSIVYTSLLMSCGQQQTFYALGGCSPLEWSITSGGGTIDQAGNYTAPATNVNCVDNPTIQVTDCCGNTATIKLAVSCYSGGGAAIELGTLIEWNCTYDPYGYCIPGIPWYCLHNYETKAYDCSGNLLSDCVTGVAGYCYTSDTPPTDCWTNQCGCSGPGSVHCTCGVPLDVRTTTQKSGGCCPLNPWTGLPYD